MNTVDDEGNTIEMTDEEKAAALEEEKAEALQARLEAGEDPEALAEEFSDSLYSSEVALEQMGSLTELPVFWMMPVSPGWRLGSRDHWVKVST